MGIFIYLHISKSVTKDEWEKVYEETLQLVRKFPLADIQSKKIHGIRLNCLVRTDEIELNEGYYAHDKWIGWNAVGDYQTMLRAEEYALQRNMVSEKSFDKNADDILMELLSEDIIGEEADKHDGFRAYAPWGGKTQGRPYHILMLSVAALIAARLPGRTYVSGDVTRGQFRNAIRYANQCLEEPIDLPEYCDIERFMKRIKALPLPAVKQIDAFRELFIGTLDASFGDCLRRNYPDSVLDEYWIENFREAEVDTGGFASEFRDYMLWGFSLEKLCRYTDFRDREGKVNYGEFIRCVMNAKLHLREKDCRDFLVTDQEEEYPYGIGTLFARIVLRGGSNRKIDRYIPIEEIREALVQGIGDRYDVNRAIDDCLVEEAAEAPIDLANTDRQKEELERAVNQDPAEAVNQVLDIRQREQDKRREQYDITNGRQLLTYKRGDTLAPEWERAITDSKRFLNKTYQEEVFRKVLMLDEHMQCQWIKDNNRYYMIRDIDWEKIFTKVEEPGGIVRYYPLFRVQLKTNDLLEMGTAFLLNDELWQYTGELVRKSDERT